MVDSWGEGYLNKNGPKSLGLHLIDITLVEIFKLWNNVTHWTWLNVRKKIYSVNKTVNCWQPRYFHLHQHWIPQVIPWCNYVMAIFMPIGVTISPRQMSTWIFVWGPGLHCWNNVYHATDWWAQIVSRYTPQHN